MKILSCSTACLLALAVLPAAFAQPVGRAVHDPETKSALIKFNLDFPGGTPRDLIAAIQKALGRPLNAIIPLEFAEVKLPPLKMNNVDVPQLFKALEMASSKSEAYITSTSYGGGTLSPTHSYQIVTTSYGFQTTGEMTDDSVWYFRVQKPPGPPLVSPKECRFYSLASYLDRGFTVDDITTAIQTGWKILGDTANTPTISFHKETKLLIAVGQPAKLETIDAVLRALGNDGPTASSGGAVRLGRRPGAPVIPTPPPIPQE